MANVDAKLWTVNRYVCIKLSEQNIYGEIQNRVHMNRTNDKRFDDSTEQAAEHAEENRNVEIK